MKVKLLAVLTMIVGNMAEMSYKRITGTPAKHWYLMVNTYAVHGECTPLVFTWTAEPSNVIDEKQVKEANCNDSSASYKSSKFPNRYLNVFYVERKFSNLTGTYESDAKLNYASFDVETLMAKKEIMYGSMTISYYMSGNLAELKYAEANLSDKRISDLTGTVYYGKKPVIVLESKKSAQM